MPRAFPSDALYQDYRHESTSTGGYYTNEDSEVDGPLSPVQNIPPDIVIDPALLGDAGIPQASPASSHPYDYHTQHYDQHYGISPMHHFPDQPYHDGGSYGDPNFHQSYPPSGYFPEGPHSHQPYFEHQAQSYHPQLVQPQVDGPKLPKKRGRKRRVPPREDQCSFCKGTDEKNKDGVAEAMVTCRKCGRSGHPSCLNIEQITDVIRSYEWMCMECKLCEVCQKKGREDAFLFCDMCDRGWHTYCLTPPLNEPPTGTWGCPTCCPPVAESSTVRRSSSATSSRFAADQDQGNDKAGPSKLQDSEAVSTPGDELEAPAVSEPEVTESVPHRPKKAPKQKRDRNLKRASTPVLQPLATPSLPSPTRSASHKSKDPSRSARPLVVPRVRLRLSKSKGKGKARATEEDEDPSELFDGILQGADADVSKTTITGEDKTRFENAKSAAEVKLGIVPPGLPGAIGAGSSLVHNLDPRKTNSMDVDAALTIRPLRSLTSLSHLQVHEMPTPTGASTPNQPSPLESKAGATNGTPLRIRRIRFGEFEIDTWYDAPFPEEYASVADGMLWICEFCLKYMKSRFSAGRHRLKCKMRHPPGDEIYRDENVSLFEVDGRKNKIYCQNLCLLSKMFLDHKSLFYDVEPFLFYVLTEVDDVGARFIGYFSKEKRSAKEYNLSCIMTLPVRQKRGWGNFLIDFSYLLSKKEGRIGGPETPLSALGAITYKRYWTLSLMYYFRTGPQNVTLPGISAATSMALEDVYSGLQANNMIISYDDSPSTPNPGKSSAGRNRGRPRKSGLPGPRSSVAPRKGGLATHSAEDGPTAHVPRVYRIVWDQSKAEEYVENWEKRSYARVNPERLKWSPFLLARTQAVEEAIDNSSSDPYAFVDVMQRYADEEAERLAKELAVIDIQAQVVHDELEDSPTPRKSDRGRSNSRPSNGFIPTKAPRLHLVGTSTSMIRTRSQNTAPERESRASRSRATSLSSNEDEVTNGRPKRSRSQRHAAEQAESRLKALRKRKLDSDLIFEDGDFDRTPRRRSLRRTASAAASSPGYDEESSEGDEDATDNSPEQAPRTLRSARLANGLTSRDRKSSTPAESARKKRRIDSSPEAESDNDIPRETRNRRRRAAQTETRDAAEDSPLKTRLRSRRPVATIPSDGEVPRRTRRSGRHPLSMPDSSESEPDTEAQVEEAIQAERSTPSYRGTETQDSPLSSPRGNGRLDFDSVGSLSSVGPDLDANGDVKDEITSEVGVSGLSARPRSADALALLATAVDYVAPKGVKASVSGQADLKAATKDESDADGEPDEMDAEGEADWD